jgi:hypothetical protein
MADITVARAARRNIKSLPTGVPVNIREIWIFLGMNILANGPDIDV